LFARITETVLELMCHVSFLTLVFLMLLQRRFR